MSFAVIDAAEDDFVGIVPVSSELAAEEYFVVAPVVAEKYASVTVDSTYIETVEVANDAAVETARAVWMDQHFSFPVRLQQPLLGIHLVASLANWNQISVASNDSYPFLGNSKPEHSDPHYYLSST